MARPLLLRLPNWLGDLVQAWPVVRAAAEGEAIFLGPESFAPILAPRFPSVPYLVTSRGRRFAVVPSIRRSDPGRALLLTDSLSSALVAVLAGVPERVGYAAECRDLLLTRRVPRRAPARSRPRVEEYLDLAAAAGLAVKDPNPSLHATEEERARGMDLLRKRGYDHGPYAVIAAGASYGPAKRWPPGRFAAVARALHDKDGTRAVLVGSKEDRAASAEVALALGSIALDLTGATDLPALVGILDRSGLVLSNDSGVMHVAAALGKRTVAIFGSTSPVWSSARAPWVRSLYAAYPCSPCFRRSCPIGYGCLRAIEAEEVIAAAGS